MDKRFCAIFHIIHNRNIELDIMIVGMIVEKNETLKSDPETSA